MTAPDVVTEPFARVRPKITERNAHFWQLRGGAGDHQVKPLPEVAVVSTGASHFTGCMLVAAG